MTLREQPKNGHRLAISPTRIDGVVGDDGYGVDLELWELPRTATLADDKPRLGPIVMRGAKATYVRTWGEWAAFWLAGADGFTGYWEIVLITCPRGLVTP